MSQTKIEKFWEFDPATGETIEVEREVRVRGFCPMKPVGKAASFSWPKPAEADDLDGEPVYGAQPPKDAA